jgi:hypothetical protein
VPDARRTGRAPFAARARDNVVRIRRMANRMGRRVALTVALGALAACSSGGKSGVTGAAGGAAGASAGASGSAGAAGAGTGGVAAAGTAGSGAGGSATAGSGAGGSGTAGGGAGGAAPTDAGTTNDGGGPSNDARAAAAHETGPTSCAGRAISLAANGTGSDSDAARARVVIDLMADMPLGNTSRTIEFWFYVKPTDWIAEKNEILFYGALTGGTRQVIGLDFGITSTASQWVHIAIVWDGLALRTYVNGVARITTLAPANQPLATLAGLFTVGCLPLNFSCFNGLFDELRVWNVARTPDEIMKTYTKAVVGNETGLVGYWKFDDAPGSATAADSVTTTGHTAHAGVLTSATDAGAPTFVTPDPPAPVACP